MREVFEKIINFIHSEIARTTSYAEHDTLINVKFFVEELGEKYKHCALCYLQSPCEYQNENAILQNELLADNNGWIPCSDRLPEVNTTYLVSLEGYCKPLIAWFGSDKEWYWYNSTAKMDYVIAWQQLPEPHKECER